MNASASDVPALPSAGLLGFIERASRDPEFDIAKFGALLDRHEAMVERQKKDAFNRDMAGVQGEIGTILRSGKNPTFNNPYAKLEDLDRQARPIYSAHGFSVRYGSAQPPREGWLRVTLTIAHRDGYSEEHYLDGPIDSQSSERQRRTAIQAVGSTVTYLRRYLLQMVLNLVPGNNPEDDDGENQRRRTKIDPPEPGEDARDAINRELPLQGQDDPIARQERWLDDLEVRLQGCTTREDYDLIAQSRDVVGAQRGLKEPQLTRLWKMLGEYAEALDNPTITPEDRLGA